MKKFKLKRFNTHLNVILYALVIVVCLFVIFSIQSTPATYDKSKSIKVPILMYHSLLKDVSRSGKFTITPKQFEADLKYIREHGYNTITMSELIDYVHGDGDLPKNPIMITFDDGYYNVYVYAFPLAQQYNMKFVFGVIGKYSERDSEENTINAAYSSITWTHLRQMQASGLVDVQNHSYDMHNYTDGRKGAGKKYNESPEEYKKAFMQDTKKLQDLLYESAGILPNTYAYPMGSISDGTTGMLEELGFKASLSSQEGINYISKGCNLFLLRRYNRGCRYSTEEFFNKILKDYNKV